MAGDDVVKLKVFHHDAWGDDDYFGSVRQQKPLFFWYNFLTYNRKTSNLTFLTTACDHVVEGSDFDHDAWGDDDYLGSVQTSFESHSWSSNVNV